MDDLIKYLNSIRNKLEGYTITTFSIQLIMDEICDIATENWVKTGVPNLSQEQFFKVMLRIGGDTTLN